MSYKHITIPEKGEKLTVTNGKPQGSKNPIVGFIEGDGIGPDVWKAVSAVRP